MGCLKVFAAVCVVGTLLLGFLYFPLWILSVFFLVMLVSTPHRHAPRLRRRRRRE